MMNIVTLSDRMAADCKSKAKKVKKKFPAFSKVYFMENKNATSLL